MDSLADITTTLLYTFLFISLYFQVFLLVSFFEARERIRKEEEPLRPLAGYPSVSIIVPCFNEELTLARTMDSLFALDYPKDKLDIIIVDDGSTDGTWKVAQAFGKRHGVRVLRKENGGKHTALNHALIGIRTDLVGCLDADSFVFPDTLRKIVAYFEDATVMAVTPAIKIHAPKSVLERMQHVEYTMSIFLRKVLGMFDALQVTPGPFSIFRRKVFDDLGPYKKAHNTEDLEIAFRMHHNHYRIVNSHKAFVETVAPRTIKGLYKQRLRWVHGFLENALDYKHLFFNRRYGDFGMFILPAAIISVFGALYLVGYSLVHGARYLSDRAGDIAANGFHLPSFDPFFINTDSMVFIVLALFSLTLLIVALGKSMADEGRWKEPMGLVYFLAIYGFIVPAWLFMAVFNTVLSRQNTWR